MPYVISKNLQHCCCQCESHQWLIKYLLPVEWGVHKVMKRWMCPQILLKWNKLQWQLYLQDKSILDIRLTLEYLETKGIPVITIGQDEFPSFYSRKSGFNSPLRSDLVEEIANLLNTKWQMGLNGAVLIANPLPADQEIVAEEMEVHIQKALKAKERKIRAKKSLHFYYNTFQNIQKAKP
jgi:hypothetical protein